MQVNNKLLIATYVTANKRMGTWKTPFARMKWNLYLLELRVIERPNTESQMAGENQTFQCSRVAPCSMSYDVTIQTTAFNDIWLNAGTDATLHLKWWPKIEWNDNRGIHLNWWPIMSLLSTLCFHICSSTPLVNPCSKNKDFNWLYIIQRI